AAMFVDRVRGIGDYRHLKAVAGLVGETHLLAPGIALPGREGPGVRIRADQRAQPGLAGLAQIDPLDPASPGARLPFVGDGPLAVDDRAFDARFRRGDGLDPQVRRWRERDVYDVRLARIVAGEDEFVGI